MNTFYIRAAVIVAILFVSATLLSAQDFTGNVRVNDSGPGSLQAAPQVQSGPDGKIHVVWNDFRSGRSEITMATSTDGGRTFSSSRALFPGRTALALMQRGVQFVVDRRGGFHMVWQEQNGLGNVSAMYARSTDAGLTFSQPMFAGADTGRYNQDFPSVAVDSSDNVSIAWIDDREKENGTSTNTQLFVTRSSDRGATFDTPKRAGIMPGGAGGSCECCNTAIATSRDGDVFISFRGNINNNRDIHVSRSTDDGATFTVFKAASSSWLLNACPMTGSSIAVDSNSRAHVVWRDSRQAASGKDLIYYATLGRDATACTDDMVISDSPKKVNYPTIAITREGEILVTWQDNRADGMDVRYVRSLDGGNTFSLSDKLTPEASTSRQELASVTIGPDGTRYAVWQDTQRDEGDILLSRDASPSAVISPDNVTLVAPNDSAVVATLSMLTWNAPENLGDARQVVYDVELTSLIGAQQTTTVTRGRTVRSFPFNPVPGTYWWQITARTLTGTSKSERYTFTISPSARIGESAHDAFTATIRPMPTGSNAGATLRFSVARASHVSVVIVDVAGSVVEQSLSAELDARDHVLAVGRDLAPGYYQCIVTSGTSRSVLRLVVR